MENFFLLRLAFDDILRYLTVEDRRETTIKDYRISYGHVLEFYGLRGIRDYTPEANELFRKWTDNLYDKGFVCKNFHNARIRVSRYIDNYWAGRRINILNEIPVDEIPRAVVRVIPRLASLTLGQQKLLDGYEARLMASGIRKTAHAKASRATLLLSFMAMKGIDDFNKLRMPVILEFLDDCATEGLDMNGVMEMLRGFLSHLEWIGLKDGDASQHLMPFKKWRNSVVLPAFTTQEFRMMFDGIDRSTSEGMRDYAILVLASFTGRRGCDIANLRLGDIDLESGSLRFRQEKTGVLLELPVDPIAVSTLREYLHAARPQGAGMDHLFLSGHQPYRKMTSMAPVMGRIMDRCGIERAKGKGFHAIRRSMGLWLLQSRADHDMISMVLGHTDAKAFMRYIPIKPHEMRFCALGLDGIECKSEVFHGV